MWGWIRRTYRVTMILLKLQLLLTPQEYIVFDLLFLRISFWTSAFTVSKGSPLLNCLHLQLYFLLSHFIFCSFLFFILYFLSFICVPSMLPKTNWASLHFGNRTCMTSTTAFDVLEKSRNFLPLLYACLLIFTCIYCVHWGQCII